MLRVFELLDFAVEMADFFDRALDFRANSFHLMARNGTRRMASEVSTLARFSLAQSRLRGLLVGDRSGFDLLLQLLQLLVQHDDIGKLLGRFGAHS